MLSESQSQYEYGLTICRALKVQPLRNTKTVFVVAFLRSVLKRVNQTKNQASIVPDSYFFFLLLLVLS